MNEEIRRRSKGGPCAPCSDCAGLSHHWLLESTEPCDSFSEVSDLPPLALAVAAEDDSFILWVCKHCDAWMEVMPDDDPEGGDDCDLDVEWDKATIVLKVGCT